MPLPDNVEKEANKLAALADNSDAAGFYQEIGSMRQQVAEGKMTAKDYNAAVMISPERQGRDTKCDKIVINGQIDFQTQGDIYEKLDSNAKNLISPGLVYKH